MFTRKEANNIISPGGSRRYVPDVTIDKINVFYSSGLGIKKENVEATMARNKYGSVTYELNVQPSEFPTEKPVLAKLNLSVRDVDKGTWFNDEEKNRYLKIRVLQSTNPQTTQQIINGTLNIYSKNLSQVDGVTEILLSVSKSGELGDYYHYSSGDGIIYKIPYEASFEFDQSDHVYYFAACYMDVDAMVTDGSLTRTPRKLGRYRGSVASEPLVIRGNRVNTRAVFLDQSGFIWQGPINFGLGPSADDEADLNSLQRVGVGNSKIHDYTLFESLKKSIEFPSTVLDKKSYFSKAYMSRDKNNACRFIFNFDYLTAIKANTKYPGLTLSMPEGYKSARIKSIQVFRQRVAKEDYSATKGSVVPKELICDSSDLATGVLRKSYNEVDLDKDGVNETYIGSISEINLRDSGKLRSFMVFDNSMTSAESGNHQYTVEILLEDPTDKLLLKKLRSIRRIKSDMLSYYALASMPGKFIHESNRFSPSFVKAAREQQGIPSASEFNNSQDASMVRASVWNKSIYDFLSILSTLTNKRFHDYYKKLSHMIRPSTGTTYGIGEFIKLIEQAEDYLIKALGGNEPGAEFSSHNRSDLKKAHGSLTRGMITINHTFGEIFNSRIISNLGYDYWGGSAQSSRSGLTYVTKSSLRQRFQQSGRRTYNSLTPSELRYSIGKIDLLSGKGLGDSAVTANAVLASIDTQAGSMSHSVPPVGASEGVEWGVGGMIPSEPLLSEPIDFEVSSLDAQVDIYEEEEEMEADDQVPAEEVLSDGDKFLSKGDLDMSFDASVGSRRGGTDEERRARREMASSLSIDADGDYLSRSDLGMGIEYFRGTGRGGALDDSWEIFNGGLLSSDERREAILIRLSGTGVGLDTENLESAELGAFDEVVLLLPEDMPSETGEPDELQSVDYGGDEITYDEAEEAAPDPDVLGLAPATIFAPEEIYLEDVIALDGVYVLPSRVTVAQTQEQVVVQETRTAARFQSDPTAAYLIRTEATAGTAGSPGAPSYSYSDTPGIINTGPRGMTITFSPYDLVASARTARGLETQVRRGTTSRSATSRTSGGSRGGSSGGGY